MITTVQHLEARKRIVPCLCMTCGVRNDHTHSSGYCQNGHDNWLEYRDVYRYNEFFLKALKQSGLTENEFIDMFLDIENKFIPQTSPMKDKNGIEIKKGDTVEVPEPIDSDLHNHEFTGSVEDFHHEYVVVIDGDGECFCIEPERLTVNNEPA